jgi:hypothetical protein
MNNFLIGIRRLIYGFQKQTRETIWQYMDELATDSDIYSKELKDFCPEVANDRLFVYASNHNLVVVLLDTSGREEKTGPEARVKAVLNIIETRLENSRHYVSLFGVVLTGKTIKEPALSPLDEEFAEIKSHTVTGHEILKAISTHACARRNCLCFIIPKTRMGVNHFR